MIIINQILDETLKYAREINASKALFWQIFSRPEQQAGIAQAFASLVDLPGKTYLEKKEINRALGLPSDHRQFSDHFFFLNSANENFMTLGDFTTYLKRYLVVQAPAAGYTNQPNPMVSQINQILQKELVFFNALQSKKDALRANFSNENRYFDFLLGLFHDLSTYSTRAKIQAIDFQKFNVDLRQKHGFPLFSMAEFSLLQSYFDMNCDAAISQEEFMYMMMDYPLVQRYFQLRLHEHVKRVGSEPFLPFNRNDVNVQYNLNNYVLGDFQPAGQQNLKAMIMRGSQDPRFESDAVMVGQNMVFKQKNYEQLLRGQNFPQVVTAVDPNAAAEEQHEMQAHSGVDTQYQYEQNLTESRRIILKDIKMTQLTVDEVAHRQENLSQMDEVQSRDLGSVRKPPPVRENVEDSMEASLGQIDAAVRNNVAGFRY